MTSKRPSLKERALEKIGLGHRFRSGSSPGNNHDGSQSDFSSTGSLTDVGTDHHKDKVKKSHSHTIWYSGSIEPSKKEGIIEKNVNQQKDEFKQEDRNSGSDKNASWVTLSTDNGSGNNPEKKKKLRPVGTREYVVKNSDTFESISAFFDITPSELRKLNKLTTQYIYPGQVLYVPGRTETNENTDAPFQTTGSLSKDRPTMDVPLIRMADKPPTRIPGHVERQTSVPSPTEPPERNLPHILSEDEAKKLDQDCYERFIKVSVKHITDGQKTEQQLERKKIILEGFEIVDKDHHFLVFCGEFLEEQIIAKSSVVSERYGDEDLNIVLPLEGVVSGVLLVTPNAVMFDPNVSDPLVVEHGPEKYGVIAPMDMIMAAAMYHDIAAMRHGKHDEDDIPSKPVVYHDKTCPLYRSWCASHSNLFEENDLPSSPTGGDKETPHDHNTTANSEVSEAGSVCSCGASGELSNQMVTPSSPMKDIVTSDVREPTNQNKDLIPHDQKIDSQKQDIHSPASEKADSEFGDFECAEMPKPLASNMICSDKEFVSVNLVTKTLEPDEITGTEKLQSTESDILNVKDSEVSQSPDKNRTLFYLDHSPKSEDSKDLNSQANSETCDTPEDESQKPCDIIKEPSGELRIGNILYLPVEEDSKGQITVKAIDDTKSVLTKLSEGEIEERARSHSAPVDVPQERASNRHSMGSFGSFSVSPHLNAFVNYATGFFKTNPDVKDISDVIPDTNGKQSTDGNRAVEENGDKSSPDDKLRMTVQRHSKNGKSGDLMDLEVAVENAVKLADKPELFQSFDKLIPRPAQKFEDPPLYLCLKLGRPINREISQTCPMEAYKKLKKKPEYWFSIPRDKVDHLYAFFVQWTPEIYGGEDEVDAKKRGFVVLDDNDEVNLNSDDEKIEIMEEYFSSASLQKDWEIISKDEAFKRRSVDEETHIFPDLIGTSKILEKEHIYTINKFLPARTIGYPWTLVYSTEQHGFSLKTMYRDMLGIDSPILLVVKDTMNIVFGAVTSCELKVSDHFYGTGESFLYTFHPEFQIFRWTGENNFFIKGNAESLYIGAGQGVFGLWFDGDLYHGRTNRCETYDNDLLTVSEDFVVKGFEAWAFISDI